MERNYISGIVKETYKYRQTVIQTDHRHVNFSSSVLKCLTAGAFEDSTKV